MANSTLDVTQPFDRPQKLLRLFDNGDGTYSVSSAIKFDSSNLSAFGTLETAELDPVLHLDFIYGINVQTGVETELNGGSVDTLNGRLRVQSSTAVVQLSNPSLYMVALIKAQQYKQSFWERDKKQQRDLSFKKAKIILKMKQEKKKKRREAMLENLAKARKAKEKQNDQ